MGESNVKGYVDFCQQQIHTNFNSRLFESLKIKANLSRSEHMRGHPVSTETRDKLRRANIGKTASVESRMKMSATRKGRALSPKHIESIRNIHIGRKRSEETRAKLRAERATRVPQVCPHCNKSVLPGNYHRWHGDNCKHRINDSI